MKKSERYEKEVRMIAMSLKEGQGFEWVVIEDVTPRTEKTFLNNLIKKYSSLIKENDTFEINNARNNKIMAVLTSRLAKVNEF